MSNRSLFESALIVDAVSDLLLSIPQGLFPPLIFPPAHKFPQFLAFHMVIVQVF